MPRKGLDYAWGRPSIDSLKAAGITFCCRYLSPSTTGKNLDAAEAARLQAAGIDVVSNWEWYGDWQHDYSGGYNRGRAQALEADRQHRACGGPPDRPIYFSTDFNPTAQQLPTIADYYRGVASVIGLARTGAYGGIGTISFLFNIGVIRWGWQTYAWSAGQWDGRAQIRQVQNGVLIGGVDCDINQAMVDDFGQWSGGQPDMDPKGKDIVAGVENARVFNDMWVWLAMLAQGASSRDDDRFKTENPAPRWHKELVDKLAEVKATASTGGGGFSDAQAAAMADRVAAALVDRTDNPLGPADRPVIVEGVKQALRDILTSGAG